MQELYAKALELMTAIEGNSTITIHDHDFDNVKEAIVLLLKEQDRDTRHACAEKVSQLAMDNNTIAAAHNVIMNTHGYPTNV